MNVEEPQRGERLNRRDSDLGLKGMKDRVFLDGASVDTGSVGGSTATPLVAPAKVGNRGFLGKVTELLRQMEGVTVALATPLNEQGELDVQGLEKLVERVIAAQVSCLFPLGWMGEEPLLTDRVRCEMMRETCRLARGRLPVMIGVSEQSLPRSLELAGMAQQAGADLILSTPPYSYQIPQSLIFEYSKELAAQSGMPLVVYQNDEVGVRVELETMLRLSAREGIVGVKAYTPFIQLQRCFHQVNQPGRFAVMSGDEYVYGAALLLGIRHFTMGGPGNVCPRWCTSTYRSALDNDWTAVTEKQRRLTDLCDAMYLGVKSPSAAIKYALECLGVCSAHISSPHRVVSPEEKQPVQRALSEFADVVRA